MVHLVTGYAGMEHITSADQGSFNASFFGTGQYVMEAGRGMEASIIDNNTVRIYDGDMLMHGRHIRIPPDNYEDMTIRTGAAGKNRIDLICMTYEKNTSDGTEKAFLEVLNGTETEGMPEIPDHVYGNILGGAEKNQMPLYKVVISGVVLSDITCLFGTVPTYKTLAEEYAKEFRKSCETYLGALGIIDTMDGIMMNTKDRQLAGALALKEYAEGLLDTIGDDDISGIGDGTVKGAINALNTGISYWIDNGYLPIPGSFVPVNILSLSVADFSRVSLTAASSSLSKSEGNFVLQTTYPESNSKNGIWESSNLNIGKATTFQYAVNQTFSNPTGCGILFYLVEEGTDAVEQLIYVSTTNGTGTINLNLKSTKKYKLRIVHESRNGTTTTTITKLSFS